MTNLELTEIDPYDDSSADLSQGEVDDDVRAREMAKEGEVREVLASVENRAVAWLRVLVFFVLMATALLVSAGTYIYTRDGEEETFENDFSANAAKVIEAFHDAVGRKLGAVDTLSATFTSIAISTGATFPNVTIPDIEVRSKKGWPPASLFELGSLLTSHNCLFLHKNSFMVRMCGLVLIRHYVSGCRLSLMRREKDGRRMLQRINISCKG